MLSLLDRYFSLLKTLLTGLMVLLLVPVLLQILSRFVGFIPRYVWTEELARFAFIWIVMVGSTVAVREQTHFHVDILPKRSAGREHVLRLVLLIAMMLLAIVFVVGGYYFTRFGATQHSEIAGLPMWAIYLAWPLAGLTWIMFLLEQVYQQFLASQSE